MIGRFAAWTPFGIALVVLSVQGARAQPVDPAVRPSPTPAARTTAPSLVPKDFDPCGGPLELLNKTGSGTACVFVRGEVGLTAQYGVATISGNALSTSLRAFDIPASVLYVGVLPRAQVVVTLPSFAQITSRAVAAPPASGGVVAGATNMAFAYEQLVYVDRRTLATGAIDLTYEAPTGSSRLRGAGPAYLVSPLLTEPLRNNFSLTLVVQIQNSATTSSAGAVQRGWSCAAQFVPSWQSPGGTQFTLTVQHDFSADVTPIALSGAQLIGRHFEFSAGYGGFGYSAVRRTPFEGLASASTVAYPRGFTVGVDYLIGRSDLPPGL